MCMLMNKLFPCNEIVSKNPAAENHNLLNYYLTKNNSIFLYAHIFQLYYFFIYIL